MENDPLRILLRKLSAHLALTFRIHGCIIVYLRSNQEGSMMKDSSREAFAELIRASTLSQAALARKSGVSRVQISRIVNGKAKTIQPPTRKKLLAALDIRDTGNSHNGAANYRRTVEEHLGTKSFAGLGLPELPEQRLDTIFVPLQATRHTVQPDGCDADELASNVARDSYAKAADESSRVSIDRLIVSNPRLVIVGCPGAGKTTALEFTAVRTARGELFGQDCLPVFVRLPEFAAALDISPSVDFLSWIIARAREVKSAGLDKGLTEWLKSRDRTVLFLFDGLDEVPKEADRRRLVETTLKFVRQYPANRFCITSRPIGFDPTPWNGAGFEVFRLIEYGDDQIDEAISKWSGVLADNKAESAKSVGEELSTAIRQDSRVRQIAANPLILTILIFLCRSRGYALPRRRVDLYAKVAEIFLDSWESSKRQTAAFSETFNIDLHTRELSWLISDVALEMQRRGLVLAKRWWIEQRIEETLTVRIGLESDAAKDATGRILRFISDRTGLLEERALDLYGFSHRAVQEYLAAVGAINEADAGGSHALPRMLRPHLFQPAWTEVIRLIASQITPPRAEELIRVILDDPDPSGRFLHRGPLLAVRCLLDGATIANRRLIEQLFRSFDDLGKSKWLGITLEALGELRQFNDTRFESHAADAIDRILAEAREELEDDDYASLVLSPHAPGVELEIRGIGGQEADQSAILEFSVSSGDIRRQFHVPNFDLLSDDLEVWHKSAVAIIDDPQINMKVKEIVLRQMGTLARLPHTKARRRSRVRLKHILRASDNQQLRTAAAYALGECAPSAKNLLLGVLANDTISSVRAGAAYALAGIISDDARVKQVLLNCLENGAQEEIQIETAFALRDVAANDASVGEVLLQHAESATSKRLQVACVRSLEPRLKESSEIQERFRRWAFDDGPKTRVACQILAEAFGERDVIRWDAELVSRVEEVLRSIGQPGRHLGRPCPHAWWALEALVDARESQCGLRMETMLADYLEPFSERLRWAFVFGSVARNQQSDCSDIDLALIGDVTMRDVSPAIRQAEHALGRAVNPVIYSVETFVERLHAGDPFLTEVIRESKIPLRTGSRGLSVEELDGELRAMEAERLAHA